ncbi:PAS domain-containing sensor histidine kinase [Pedobacter frigidisoli]|uniref:sensor histidine kinase n=1 Tax=Pedobacter frigidisoli TaxID=2530455 RepID=UPI00292F7201|nr:PAS domain-containing sensor histidine kinase [Pedobacter frigidisoli]
MMPKENEQIFCQMGNVSSDGYFIYDLKHQIFSYFNTALSRIFGLTEEGALTVDQLKEKIHVEDLVHVSNCYQELLEDGGAKKYVFRISLVDVEKHLKSNLTYAEDSGHIYGVIEDITVDRQNQIHIEQINARKNITLEVLSHDLKEPLAMIRMTASSMQSNIRQMEEKDLRSSLQFISEMCERNLKLIRSMVNHEFIKSAVVAIKKERADLVWELKDVVRFYSRSHLSKVRNFSFSSPQDKIFIFLDSMKFMQVINNLVSNAIKFTRVGGNIMVQAEQRGDKVIVSVSDDGIGIPKEMRNNLFNHSKEVLRKGLKGEESGGLGMNIIKDIVDLHGGRIWVLSEEGLGTSFFIELPEQ